MSPLGDPLLRAHMNTAPSGWIASTSGHLDDTTEAVRRQGPSLFLSHHRRPLGGILSKTILWIRKCQWRTRRHSGEEKSGQSSFWVHGAVKEESKVQIALFYQGGRILERQKFGSF